MRYFVAAIYKLVATVELNKCRQTKKKLLIKQEQKDMYIGVFAKKNGNLCNNGSPISLGESTELVNILMDAVKFYEKVVTSEILEDDYIKALKFTDEEMKSLKFCQAGEYAEEAVQNKEIYAIGLFTNEHCKYEYKDTYLDYENWSKYYVLKSALEKVLKLSNIYIKASIINTEDSSIMDYFLYDYEQLNYLLGTINCFKEICNADEFALYWTN